MCPRAWPSVNDEEPGVWAVSVLLVSVLIGSFCAELGGETAPPASAMPPAALAPVEATSLAECFASVAVSDAGLEQAPSAPIAIAMLASTAALLVFMSGSP